MRTGNHTSLVVSGIAYKVLIVINRYIQLYCLCGNHDCTIFGSIEPLYFHHACHSSCPSAVVNWARVGTSLQAILLLSLVGHQAK